MLLARRVSIALFSLSVLTSELPAQGPSMIGKIAAVIAGLPQYAVRVYLGLNPAESRSAGPAVDLQRFQSTLADSFAASLRPYTAEITTLRTLQTFYGIGHRMRKASSVLLLLTSTELDDAALQHPNVRVVISSAFMDNFRELCFQYGMAEPDAPMPARTPGASPGLWEQVPDSKETSVDPALHATLDPAIDGIEDAMQALRRTYLDARHGGTERLPTDSEVFRRFPTMHELLVKLDGDLETLEGQVEAHLGLYHDALANLPGLGEVGAGGSPERKDPGGDQNRSAEGRKSSPGS